MIFSLPVGYLFGVSARPACSADFDLLYCRGAGLDADWKCVGEQESECEKKFFNWFERSGSWTLGLFWHSFDVSRFSDDMREKVKNPIPPEPPTWDGVWPPYGIN